MNSLISWMKIFIYNGQTRTLPSQHEQAEIDKHFIDDCLGAQQEKTATTHCLPANMLELVSATRSGKRKGCPSNEVIAGVYAFKLSKQIAPTIHVDLRKLLGTFMQLGAIFNYDEAFRIALYLRDHEAKRYATRSYLR